MQKQKVVRIVLATVVAFVSWYFALTAEGFKDVEIRHSVVVAVKPVQAGTVINNSMVTVIDIPQSLRVTDSVKSLDQVVGKVSTMPLAANEVVRESRLESGPIVSPEYRIMRLGVSMITSGTTIKPGDEVDILAVSDNETEVILPGAKIRFVYDKDGKTLYNLDGTKSKEAANIPSFIEIYVPNVYTALKIRQAIKNGWDLSVVGYGISAIVNDEREENEQVMDAETEIVEDLI
ncbi:SAF domain-containing protein [Heliorestis acidaminivorans]|uniref:SAF domain-containing protein n=1 Tax=Heliorestis acidaminivorans TaxID=553427 RepID=UPI0014797AD7|nr:SAF domain-containing protein [Heliorestis acidaminivorans]